MERMELLKAIRTASWPSLHHALHSVIDYASWCEDLDSNTILEIIEESLEFPLGEDSRAYRGKEVI